MNQETRLLAAALLMSFASSIAMAETFSALRGGTPLDREGPAPILAPQQNTSLREPRNYPEQPPVIPHSIEGYQVSVYANKCLDARDAGWQDGTQVQIWSCSYADNQLWY